LNYENYNREQSSRLASDRWLTFLRPKLKFAAIIGFFGWRTKAVEQITGLMPNLKAEEH
jgi:flavorubredoxin